MVNIMSKNDAISKKEQIIDFHAHILPNADHGSTSVEMSIRQLKRAQAAGVTQIVATPHFYPGRHTCKDFMERRLNSYHQLRDFLSEDSENYPEIFLGAEVLICEGMENMEGLSQLCIQNTNVILLELPYQWNERLTNTIYEIQAICGLTPIIAHIDRYSQQCIQSLFKMNVYTQINAEILCRRFKRIPYLKWVKEEKIHALGSDVHLDGTHYTDFSKALHVLKNQKRNLMERTQNLLYPEKIYQFEE